MKELPNIVRERLKAGMTAAADHPDADQLTAFAEQALSETERARVLHHLAGCRACRNILSLATAEFDSVPAHSVATVPASRSWLNFSLLRWGTAGALAVIVGAALMLRDQHRYASTPPQAELAIPGVEKRTDEALAGRATSATTAARLPAPVQKSGNAPALTLEARKLPETEKPSGGRDALARPNALIADAVSPSSPGKDASKALASNSQFAAASPTADLRTKNVLELDQKQSTGMAGYTVPGAAPKVAIVGGSAEPIPGKAKEEISRAAIAKASAGGNSGVAKRGALDANGAAAYGDAMIAPEQPLGAASAGVTVTPASPPVQTSALASIGKAKVNRPAPRWTLSAEGALERSYDSGRTWETIPVGNGAAFRAFSVIGADLWVGGAKGALYHSSDSADHWTQVTPTVDGAALSIDITRIEFTDLQHGKITTTTDETWITSDAGQTWQKR
jgi:hypothetical protein